LLKKRGGGEKKGGKREWSGREVKEWKGYFFMMFLMREKGVGCPR